MEYIIKKTTAISEMIEGATHKMKQYDIFKKQCMKNVKEYNKQADWAYNCEIAELSFENFKKQAPPEFQKLHTKHIAASKTSYYFANFSKYGDELDESIKKFQNKTETTDGVEKVNYNEKMIDDSLSNPDDFWQEHAFVMSFYREPDEVKKYIKSSLALYRGFISTFTILNLLYGTITKIDEEPYRRGQIWAKYIDRIKEDLLTNLEASEDLANGENENYQEREYLNMAEFIQNEVKRLDYMRTFATHHKYMTDTKEEMCPKLGLVLEIIEDFGWESFCSDGEDSSDDQES